MKSAILHIILELRRVFYILYAKMQKKSFYCQALAGETYYSITINLDLTVSCNCNDFFGLGILGSLKEQNLKEILSGKKASNFRKLLKRGIPPIANCVVCSDLCLASRKDVEKNIDIFKVSKGIKIENTLNCNLNCLSCLRKKIYTLRKKRSLSLDEIEIIARLIKKDNIDHIFYFNLGEPFFHDQIKEELKIIRQYNPNAFICTSTNGTLLDTKEKREAALLFDCIFFSIHGSTQKSANKYQKGTNFDRAYGNMKALIQTRNSLNIKKPEISWKYILFRWNDSKKLIDRAINLAKEAKVDQIFFEKTVSPFLGWPYILGPSYKHYLGLGYLNKIGRKEGKQFFIDFNKNEKDSSLS